MLALVMPKFMAALRYISSEICDNMNVCGNTEVYDDAIVGVDYANGIK